MIHLIDDKSYDISTCFDFNEHLLAFLTSIEYYYIMNIIMIIMYFKRFTIYREFCKLILGIVSKKLENESSIKESDVILVLTLNERAHFSRIMTSRSADF